MHTAEPWAKPTPTPATPPRAGQAPAGRAQPGPALRPRQRLPLAALAQAAGPQVAVWADAAPLDQLLGLCRRQGRLAALLLIELQPADPDTAAALAQAIGQRLRSRVRSHDVVALTADGAFAVLLRDVGEQASLQVRSRLEPELRCPYRVHADLVRPLLRIGRAVSGLDGQRGLELLRVAALPGQR